MGFKSADNRYQEATQLPQSLHENSIEIVAYIWRCMFKIFVRLIEHFGLMLRSVKDKIK